MATQTQCLLVTRVLGLVLRSEAYIQLGRGAVREAETSQGDGGLGNKLNSKGKTS